MCRIDISTPGRLATGASFMTHIESRWLIRNSIRACAAAGLLALAAGAQTPSRSQSATNPVGVWRGTSLCLVRPSPCNDELVVYRTARTTGDSLTLDARKIVHGEEQEMGVLNCEFKPASGQLTCAMPRGTWRFQVRNDSITGELRLPDNTKFRDVRAARAR